MFKYCSQPFTLRIKSKSEDALLERDTVGTLFFLKYSLENFLKLVMASNSSFDYLVKFDSL